MTKQEKIVSVVEKINERINDNPRLDRLNSGGCGFFAGIVKHYFDSLGIRSKLVYVNGYSSEFNDADEIIHKINSKRDYSSCSHVFVGVQLKGSSYLYFDGFNSSRKMHSKELWAGYKFRGVKSRVSFDMSGMEYVQKAIIEKPYQWNDMYDWNLNKALLKIVQEEFTKFNGAEVVQAQQILYLAHTMRP